MTAPDQAVATRLPWMALATDRMLSVMWISRRIQDKNRPENYAVENVEMTLPEHEKEITAAQHQRQHFDHRFRTELNVGIPRPVLILR